MNSKKKIIIIINALVTGGAENQVTNILRLLSGDFDFHVITILKNDEDYLRENIDPSKITIHPLNFSSAAVYFPVILFKILQLKRKLKPDLVHSILFQSNIIARVAGIFGKSTTINSVYDNAEMPEFNLRMLKLTDRLADRIFIDNTVGVTNYIQKKIMRPGRVFFTPNGIGLPANQNIDTALKKKIFSDINYSGNDIIWLNVARFVVQKDHITLIKAFRFVVDRDPNNKLLLAGDGELVPEILKMICDDKLENNVFYIGRINDIFTLCSISDAYVCSSVFEGMPIIIMQAMLYRLIVVSTAVGAIPDLIDNDITGYLCKKKDPEALAALMNTVIHEGTEKKECMKTAAFKKINENFSLSRLKENWYNNYINVLNGVAK